jgi:hypothetical protein
MSAAQTAARSLGKEMPVFRASNERELDTAFATMVQQQTDALVVASDQEAARSLGVQIHVVRASTVDDFDTAFSILVQQKDGGLFHANDAFSSASDDH